MSVYLCSDAIDGAAYLKYYTIVVLSVAMRVTAGIRPTVSYNLTNSYPVDRISLSKPTFTSIGH